MTKITISENLNNISKITKITIIVYFLSLTVCLDEGRKRKQREEVGGMGGWDRRGLINLIWMLYFLVRESKV